MCGEEINAGAVQRGLSVLMIHKRLAQNNARRGVRSRLIYAEQVALLFGASGPGQVLPLFLFAGLTVVFWGRVGPFLPTLAWILQIGGTLLFEWLRRGYAADRERERNTRVWAERYTVLAVICGASYGVAAIAWFIPGSPSHQFFLAMSLGAVAIFGLVSRHSHLPSLYALLVLLGVPLAVRFALEGTLIAQITGFFVLVYCAGIALWAVIMNRAQERAIALRLENEDLICSLDEARLAAEAARDEIETSARAKQAFLSVMSHEFRTPMNSIIGLAQLLKSGDLEPRRRGYLDTLEQSAKALAILLDDVLILTQLEGGQIKTETLAYRLADVVRPTFDAVRPAADAKSLVLTVHQAPDVPGIVFGDPTRVRQALLSLMANAVKFTNAGTVTLSITVETGSERNLSLCFTVADTGIGIADHLRGIVFERFTQADQSYTRLFGGIGAGLAIAKGLVTQMGGHIDFESELGKGSKFWFTVPLTVPPALTIGRAERRPNAD